MGASAAVTPGARCSRLLSRAEPTRAAAPDRNGLAFMSSAKAFSVSSRGTAATSTTSVTASATPMATAAAAGLDVEGSKDQDRRDDQSSHELFLDTPPRKGASR